MGGAGTRARALTDPAAPAGVPAGLLEGITSRGSVRSYRYREVDGETVLKLLEAATHAPTALGRESWAFLVLQDRVTLRKISEKAKQLWHEESPRREPHELLGVPPHSPFAHAAWDPTFSIFYNAGTLIVICTRAEGELADAECWMAMQNLLLAAQALGLGTCVIGAALPALRSPEIRRELGLPVGVRPVASVVVGHPQGGWGPSPRRNPEIIAWRR